MPKEALDISAILQRLSVHSARPRYTFMVLNLISEAAGAGGSVGPLVVSRAGALPVRDWLSDALAPLAARDDRRVALVNRAKAAVADDLPSDSAAASTMIDHEVRQRVRRSGKTNVSRAVSDLVRAGLLRRHYAGWKKDHRNRGGQRHAVYVVDATLWRRFGEAHSWSRCASIRRFRKMPPNLTRFVPDRPTDQEPRGCVTRQCLRVQAAFSRQEDYLNQV